MIAIPLRRQDGTVVAHALIDDVDAAQADHRWYLAPQGYAARRVIREKRQIVLLHREILGLFYGDKMQGDHINGDRLDCRRDNLRVVTPGQNAQNRGSLGGTSAHRGVCWVRARNRWLAFGNINRRMHHVGYFATEAEAVAAVREWRLTHMTHTNESRQLAHSVVARSAR